MFLAAAVTGPYLFSVEAKRANADDGRGGGTDSDSGSNNSNGGDDGGGNHDNDGSDDSGSDDSGSDDNGDGHNDGGSDNGGGNANGSKTTKDSGNSSGQRYSQPKDEQLATRLKGRIAPLRDVEALATRLVPGEIAEVRLYRRMDVYVYRVRIIQRDGSIYDVRINAVTRKLISKRER